MSLMIISDRNRASEQIFDAGRRPVDRSFLATRSAPARKLIDAPPAEGPPSFVATLPRTCQGGGLRLVARLRTDARDGHDPRHRHASIPGSGGFLAGQGQPAQRSI